MKKELSFVLNYALTKGIQIHPDAFKILDDITDVKKLERIIKEVVKEKTKQKLFQINQNDLETYLGIKDDPNLQNEMRILSDPTQKITSGEGVKGYNALFSSRFNKLKRIISDRPESKMIKSISVVKTTKLENDVYVCGLVTTRDIERNVTKLLLEDPTGSFEGIIFDVQLGTGDGTMSAEKTAEAAKTTADNIVKSIEAAEKAEGGKTTSVDLEVGGSIDDIGKDTGNENNPNEPGKTDLKKDRTELGQKILQDAIKILKAKYPNVKCIKNNKKSKSS